MNAITVIRKLTDVYAKNPNSYIGRTLLILTEQLDQIEQQGIKVEQWRNIDVAEGTTLDEFGAERGQSRGQVNDEVMRALVKTKIAQNNSDGTVPFLISFITLLLKIPASEVIITSLADVGKSATLHVNVPADSVVPTGLSLKQFGQLLNVIAASGVRVEALFEGTFSFSDDYNESQFDDEKGFADDAQTIGGTLGAVYDPTDDISLPI